MKRAAALLAAVFFLVSAAPSSAAQNTRLYIDEFYGFTVRVPDWAERQPRARQILFVKSQSKTRYSPTISVTVDDGAGAKDAEDYARVVLEHLKKEHGELTSVIEGPKAVSGMFTPGAALVVRVAKPDDAGNEALKISHRVFKLDDKLFAVVAYFDAEKDFDSGLAGVAKNLDSFRKLSRADSGSYLAGLKARKPAFGDANEASAAALRGKVGVTDQGASYVTRWFYRRLSDPSLKRSGQKALEVSLEVQAPRRFEAGTIAYNAKENLADKWRVIEDKIFVYLGVWLPMPNVADDITKNRLGMVDTFGYNRWKGWVFSQTPSAVAHEESYTIFRYTPAAAPKELATSFTSDLEAATHEIDVWVRDIDYTVRYARMAGRDAAGTPLYEIEQYFAGFGLPFTFEEPPVAAPKKA